MRSFSVFASALSLCLFGNIAGAQRPEVLRGPVHRTRDMPAPPSNGAAAGTNGISYNGGPVLDTVSGQPTKIYYIWYGDWTLDPNANGILTNLANNIGGSPYFNINTTYYDASSALVVNQIAYGGSFTVTTYPAGSGGYSKTLSDSDIQAIVASVSPTDTNALYVVLTSPDVTESTGFCTSYCGWHTAASITAGGTSRIIKYAFVGDASVKCPSACEWQSTGPNGGGGGDGMASVVAHEFEETVTDPQPVSGWYDSTHGQENADKCAWTFGTTYTSANGRIANMKLGGLDYLIQQNWVNASGGYCALSYTATPDFTLSSAPASQTMDKNQSGTPSYTINVGSQAGFNGSVALTLSGTLPAGIISNGFTPTPVTAPGSSILNLSGSSSAPGSYALSVQGTSGALNHATPITLNIGDFSIAASPGSRSLAQGGVTTYTVTVSALYGFTGTVNLSANGLPSGVSGSFSPASINSQGSSTLTLTAQASAPTGGPFTFTIEGDGPYSNSHTTTANVTVTLAPPNFTISATPPSQTVKKGSSTSYTVTLTPTNGFSSNVTLSVSNLPNKATGFFSPNPVPGGSGNSTLTVQTGSNGNAGLGTRTLTITGSGGGVTHSTTVSMTVTQ